MGLTKDDRDAVMEMYTEFRNAHGVTNDATAATLTLAAVLHLLHRYARRQGR
jgi:hypothetical protein